MTTFSDTPCSNNKKKIIYMYNVEVNPVKPFLQALTSYWPFLHSRIVIETRIPKPISVVTKCHELAASISFMLFILLRNVWRYQIIGVIGSRKSKDKKDKQRNTKHYTNMPQSWPYYEVGFISMLPQTQILSYYT